MSLLSDTIVARCSAPGSSYRGIIRLSGAASLGAVQKITVNGPLDLNDACGRSVADGELCIFSSPLPAKIFYWKDGTGYTGQEAVEIHTVGSPPVLDAVVERILADKTVRLAEPGEFTQRAFLAGRLDLTQAEAVLGVIDAKNPQALETSLNQLAGGLSGQIKTLREKLISALADLEAGFEFPEEDIEFISVAQIQETVQNALNETEDFRTKIQGRGFSHEKPVAVLFGPPNAGKSTLFNALTGRENAIVSPAAGTTRDYLEADADFDSFTCKLIDTAGTEDDLPMNEIDRTAMNFSYQLLDRADAVIHCRQNGNDDEREWKAGDGEWNVWKKGGSLSALRSQLSTQLKAQTRCDAVESTAVRCREAVAGAIFSLKECLELSDELLIAAELRNAVNALGLIDGSIYTDTLLDRVFSRFCVGK